MSGSPTLRDMLAASRKVTTVLGTAPVPAFASERDADDEPTSSGDMSPSGRIALATINLDPISQSCLARVVEAWVECDTDGRVLFMALMQKLREAGGSRHAG